MPLVLGTLQSFFSKLFMYKQNSGATEKELAAAMKTYYLDEYKFAAKHYSTPKLEQIFYILEEYDLRLKGVNNVSVKEGELLKEMVARILN